MTTNLENLEAFEKFVAYVLFGCYALIAAVFVIATCLAALNGRFFASAGFATGAAFLLWGVYWAAGELVKEARAKQEAEEATADAG